MSTVLLAKGSKLYRKNPTSSVYEEVVQCLTMGLPGTVQEWIEVTNHSSTGGYKEWVPGLKDVGAISIDIYWNPRAIAMHGTIYDDAVAEPPIQRSWGIMLPNALDGWQFAGYLAAPTGTLNINEAVRLTFTMRTTGAPLRITTGFAGLT
jgi:hypothetical protein